MAMMVGMVPEKLKDVRDLSQGVEKWEISGMDLKIEHEVEIHDQIKLALLTSMVPADLETTSFNGRMQRRHSRIPKTE